MQMAFQFSARAQKADKIVTGILVAPSSDVAFNQVKRMGFTQAEIRFDALQTLREWTGAQINARELARLYNTLGKRLEHRGSLTEALAAAQDFTQDMRLKSASSIMRAAILDGRPVHEAMLIAGLPERDAMMAKALADGGKLGKAFIDLASDILAEHRLQSSFSSMMRMPKIMLTLSYLFIPVVFLFIAPSMMSFFKRAGSLAVNIPPAVKVFYEFVGWTQAHPVLALLMYLIIPLVVIAATKAGIWHRLAQRIQMVRDLSQSADHASIWSSYALMYGAGIRPVDICQMLGKAAKRQDSRAALLRFGRLLNGGEDEVSAISAAEFPPFVVQGFKSAKTSGSLVEGLLQFSTLKKEDVELLTERLQDVMKLVSMALLALLVLAVFFVVLYPAVGPIISSF